METFLEKIPQVKSCVLQTFRNYSILIHALAFDDLSMSLNAEFVVRSVDSMLQPLGGTDLFIYLFFSPQNKQIYK